MAKKKKLQTINRLNKQIQIKHKKDFIANLKQILKLLNKEHLIKLIPDMFFENVYNERVKAFKVTTDDPVNIDKFDIEIATKSLELAFNVSMVPIAFGSNTLISVKQFLSTRTSLLSHVRALKSSTNPDAQTVYNELAELFDDNNSICEVDKVIGMAITNLIYIISKINKYHKWIDMNVAPDLKSRGFVFFPLKLAYTPVESKIITCDDKPRPAFRIGWVGSKKGVSWMTMKPSDLKIIGNFSEIPLELYMQNHALIRLHERADLTTPSLVTIDLITSLLDKNITINDKGQVLIDYKLANQKIGYLVPEIVEGVILIKTFLFLTNDDTPEFKKLNELTNLGKIDISYLKIDKLSSFLNSDIKDNPELVSLFKSAGCESLFKVGEILKSPESAQKQMANSILKYIGHQSQDQTT